MVEGALHMAKQGQLVCSRVPLPPYIKEQGGGRPALGASQGGGESSS